MWEGARKVVKDCGAMPMLVSYSCDGPPCKDVVLAVGFKDPHLQGQATLSDSAVEKARGQPEQR
eukprot:6323105-Lingulodinium_polyedra.AAC.1